MAEAGVIHVNNNDDLTVSYCPRDCTTPYIDTAKWLQIDATVTPTSLPTYAGPRPTATNTPPPGLPIEHNHATAPRQKTSATSLRSRTIRAESTISDIPRIYSGMWTSGRNRHLGMIQFSLDSLPAGAIAVDARLELVGKSRDFIDSGEWSVQLLDSSMDAGWRAANFDQSSRARHRSHGSAQFSASSS